VLKPEAMLASNTSSISITRLAASTDRPERFMGIHFMNPVPRMKLVELVRGIATEDVTFEASKAYVRCSARRRPCRRTSPPSSSTASCCR
jgi:3-hydroxybutyryl-CoA dehydrogenase